MVDFEEVNSSDEPEPARLVEYRYDEDRKKHQF